jgi:hypothetical protein
MLNLGVHTYIRSETATTHESEGCLHVSAPAIGNGRCRWIRPFGADLRQLEISPFLPRTSSADPITIAAAAVGSVNAVNGAISTEPFISRVDCAPFNQDMHSAIVEFDVSGVVGLRLARSWLTGIVSANNLLDTGPRPIRTTVLRRTPFAAGARRCKLTNLGTSAR